MSEKSFVNYENANPFYAEDQKRVLNRIEVKPMDQILPDDIYYCVKNNEFINQETIIKQDDDQIILNRSENNIFTIKRGYSLEIDSEDWKFKLLNKLVPKIYTIEDYYIVDMETKMAFDASVLWKTESSSKDGSKNYGTTVTSAPKRKEIAGFFPEISNGVILINKIDDEKIKKHHLDEKLSPAQIEFVENTSLFHESGHKYQYDGRDLIYDKKSFRLLSLLNQLPFLSRLCKKETISSFEKNRIIASETERNATAFDIAVIRKLRDLGLDLTRGLNNQQVFEAVTFGLNTYEKLFSKIDGPRISTNKNPSK